MIRSSTWYLLPLCVSLAVVGCGSQPKTSTSAGSAGSGSADLTEYQRDSLLSTSTIPGAPGVGAAMRAADATSGGIHTAESESP
jgi:hypothetical protein